MAEVKSGKETSEFSMTRLAFIAGMLLDGVGILLGTLKETGLVTSSWLPVALVICGTLLALITKLGYVRSRTVIKLAEQEASASQAVTQLAPFAKLLAEAVKEAVRPPTADPRPTPAQR